MKILSITAVALLGSVVLVHPLWYMPWLRSTPQSAAIPSAALLAASGDVLKSKLRTMAPEHFEMFITGSLRDTTNAALEFKQMLEAAGWTCDKLDSTLDSPPPSAFEIVAPAESPTANILYDWARSAGYRPHFVMKERKLAILTGSDFYFQREQSD